jgi:hypothetical protein
MIEIKPINVQFSIEIDTSCSKVTLVTHREGPYYCETSRLPRFLDSRLIDGGKVVSSYAPAVLYPPRKVLGTHFCKTLSRSQGHSAAGKIR